MKIPHYVPQTARDRLIRRINGARDMREHQLRQVARWDAELAALQSKGALTDADSEMMELIQRGRERVNQWTIESEQTQQCCERLLTDHRMREAYSQLAVAKLSEQQLQIFLESALDAAFHYEEHREWLRQAKEKAAKVTKKAEALRAALLEFEDHTFWNCPKELESLSGLISHLETHYALDEESVSDLRLSKLVSTISSAAEKFEPREADWIIAARKSRESNKKQDYLRAMTYLLFHEKQIARSPALMKAMATTAEVIINDSNIAIVYDDVRKIKI